jgi:hypothetical protein
VAPGRVYVMNDHPYKLHRPARTVGVFNGKSL